MTEFEALKYLALLVVAGFQWFLKRTINKLESDIAHLEQEIDTIKQHYLRKEDFREFREELRGLLSEIKQNIKELHK